MIDSERTTAMCSLRKSVLSPHGLASIHMKVLSWAACAVAIHPLHLPRGRNFGCCLSMSSYHKGIYHAVIQKAFSAQGYNPSWWSQPLIHADHPITAEIFSQWCLVATQLGENSGWRVCTSCLQSGSWSHHSWPVTGVQRPWADHARIHTRSTRDQDYREWGKSGHWVA